MHILLIHQAFARVDEPGGTRHHEFARFLADQGHQISIIASPVSYLTGSKEKNQKMTVEKDGKITIYRTYTYSALHKSFFHRLISFFSFMVSSFFTALRIKQVDIVWGTSPPIFQSVTALLIAKIKRVKFLLEIRDLWPAFAVAVGILKNKTIISMSEWLEKFLYKKADQVIVNSPGYIKYVQEKGARNVCLVPNGADSSIFSKKESENELKQKLGWSDYFVVLYAGAHGMSNDLPTILNTAQLLHDEKKIMFAFIGDGKEKLNLIEKSKQLALKNTQFLDPVPKVKMVDYLRAADACLAILKPIELYKTTFPNKVFDYMAASKPILLVIDGVIRKVVEEARCGFFCQPGDPNDIAACILKMKNMDRIELDQMGRNGFQYLQQHFDRQATVKIFSDMIEKMVGENV